MYKCLQGGRAIAAMLVLLFHLGWAISAEKYFDISWFSLPFSFGFTGVEFFFVLSGFIIHYAHAGDLGRPEHFKNYIYKRVVRIYPVYILIFFTVYVSAVLLPMTKGSVPADFLVILKALLLFPQDRALVGGNGSPVLTVAWTLQYEMFFYLLFGIFILNRFAGLVISGVLLVLNFFGEGERFPWTFFISDYLWLFLMGVGVGRVVVLVKEDSRLLPYFGFVGFAIYAFVIFDIVMGGDHLKESVTLLCGLGFSCIIVSIVCYERVGRVFFGGKVFQLLGAASYSLYLIHFPLISLGCKVFVFLGFKDAGVLGALISYVTIAGVSVVVALLFHQFVEAPILRKVKTLRVW